eukprot:5935168-Pyramimonas_sp.AAC.1
MISHSRAQHSIALHAVAWHRITWRATGPSTRRKGLSEMPAACPPQPCLPDLGAFECKVPPRGAGTRTTAAA